MALTILLLTPGVPLLLAAALLLRPGSLALQRLGPWAALPALLTSLLLAPGIATTVPWILQGSEFGLDRVGRLFLFFTAVIWLVAGLCARSWLYGRSWLGPRDSRFMGVFLLVMSGNLGVIVARDLLSFYLFFTLMSFASYALVVHHRSQRARHAGRIYMTFVLAGDMMIFGALVLVAQEAGGEILFEAARAGLQSAPNRHLALALLALGFGVKAGLLGMHVTLPLIYRAAPGPAGVVLAGALINAGLLGWLRLLPTGAGALEGWGAAFLVAGTAAAFYGVIVGLLQRDGRVLLAYSSISQMGIMTAALGVALTTLDPDGVLVAAVTLYALHHAFAKSALFLGGEIARRGGARHRRWIVPGLMLPALAVAGAPLTTGMLAKETLKHALGAGAPRPETVGLVEAFVAALPWMSFATTLLLARFLWLAWPRGGGSAQLGQGAVAAWCVLVLMSAVAAWLVPGASRPAGLWNAYSVWSVTWPVLSGVAVAVVAAQPALRWRLARLPVPPPGDVLALWAVVGRWGLRAWDVPVRRWAPALWGGLASAVERAGGPAWAQRAARLELWLLNWPLSLTLMLLAILVFWALLPG